MNIYDYRIFVRNTPDLSELECAYKNYNIKKNIYIYNIKTENIISLRAFDNNQYPDNKLNTSPTIQRIETFVRKYDRYIILYTVINVFFHIPPLDYHENLALLKINSRKCNSSAILT